jgi:hypothetical protein
MFLGPRPYSNVASLHGGHCDANWLSVEASSALGGTLRQEREVH